jgi:hypothetical protein
MVRSHGLGHQSLSIHAGKELQEPYGKVSAVGMFFVPRQGDSFQVTGVNPTSGLTYRQTKVATKEVRDGLEKANEARKVSWAAFFIESGTLFNGILASLTPNMLEEVKTICPDHKTIFSKARAHDLLMLIR